MTGPIDRLRGADPASALGRQPDERAEADLRLLLAEPQPARGAAPARRASERRLAPVLVTALVALLVIVGSATVLALVHPRADVEATTTPSLGSSACHPAEVLPFQCGTYRSTYGGKAVTGDLGGPAKDRLAISFTGQQGALLLTARTQNCFAERVLVRYDGRRLIRVGKPTYSQNGCFGKGVDTRSWAYAFLRGPLLYDGGIDFGSGASVVFFEYQGAAPIGVKQLPRNDLRCVAAHVAPFSCATYRSIGGTGALAFLGEHPATLGFAHLNGELTLSLSGWCNGLWSTVATDGDDLVSYGVGGTQRGCGRMPGTGSGESTPETQDDAWRAFFDGVLTYRITGSTITFTKGGSSATFER